MAVPGWVGPAATIVGGLLGNKESRAAKSQRRLMNRQINEYDYQKAFRQQLLDSIRQNADLFDPTKTLQNLNQQDFQNQALESGAAGAGYAAQGYRQGDSPVGDTLTRIGAQHRSFRYNLAVQLPQEFFMRKLQALQGVSNPNSGLLAQASDTASRIPQPAGYGNFVNALMPFLGSLGGGKKATPIPVPSGGTQLTNTFAPYQSPYQFNPSPKNPFELKFNP